MDADEVIAVALADDFRPFRVHTTDGRAVEVRSQGAVGVGHSRLTLWAQSCKIPDAKGLWYHIPYTEIVSLQPILPPAAMMTYRKIGDYLAAEPFRPFRIRMAGGQSFEIRHPEMILVGRTSARICSDVDEEGREMWHDASLLLMETIQPLEAPAHRMNGE